MGAELQELWLRMCSVFVGKSSLCLRGVSACSPRCAVHRLQWGSSALQGILVAALSCVRCEFLWEELCCWESRVGPGSQP